MTSAPRKEKAVRRFLLWLGPARVWLFIAAVAALSAEVWAPILAHGGPPAAGDCCLSISVSDGPELSHTFPGRGRSASRSRSVLVTGVNVGATGAGEESAEGDGGARGGSIENRSDVLDGVGFLISPPASDPL